jgi:hypothetical protein
MVGTLRFAHPTIRGMFVAAERWKAGADPGRA